MDRVSDEILGAILGSGLELHDLLHCARVSKRWRQLVCSSEEAWRALAAETFDFGLKAEGQAWKVFYKEQHRKKRLVMLQKHRIKVLKAQEQLASARRELEDHRRHLKQEDARRQQLEQGLMQAQRSSLAGRATQVWEPVAVRRFHSDIVEQSPVASGAHLQQINSELKLVAVQITRHVNGIRGSKSRVKEALRSLKRLEP